MSGGPCKGYVYRWGLPDSDLLADCKGYNEPGCSSCAHWSYKLGTRDWATPPNVAGIPGPTGPSGPIALVDMATLQARVAAFTLDAFKAAGAEEISWAPHPTEPDAIVVTLRLAVPPVYFEMSPTLAATLAAMDAPPKEEP